MVEVEMKFPVGDFAPLERQLAVWGARPDAPRRDADSYFCAPDRDYAQTDEALRIRRIGPANYLTYKGPKRDLQTKTRTEIEVGLAPGDEAACAFERLLTALRYRFVARVCKRRSIYHLERDGFPVEVCLDQVEGLGRFAELEIQVEEGRLDAARNVLLRLAKELGLEASERRSYLELLLRSSRSGEAAR